MVNIIVVNFNTKDLVLKAINSIYEFTDIGKFKLYVVDNGSTDGSIEALNRHSLIHNFNLILLSKNLGVGQARNYVMKKILKDGNDIVFMDSDAEIRKESWLPDMQALMIGNVGKVEAKIKNGNGTTQYAGMVFMLLKNEAILEVGMFSKEFFQTEDEDYRVRFDAEGWKTAYCKTTDIFHLGGGTIQGILRDKENGDILVKTDVAKFYAKYTSEYMDKHHHPTVRERNAQPFD